MNGKIICASVSHISLTDDDLLILLVAARRLILNGRRDTFALNAEEGLYVRVSVGQKYIDFLGLRSRQFEATVARGVVAGLVTYFVDEEYLRSVSLSWLMADHSRERGQYEGLKVVIPESPSNN